MSQWAAKRKTTRIEDRAYSLMGLFGVNMPLLYGEGYKAFQRLQEEIVKQTGDQSILAFNSSLGDDEEWELDHHSQAFKLKNLFAYSPDHFLDATSLQAVSSPMIRTAQHLTIEMLCCPCLFPHRAYLDLTLGILDCNLVTDGLSRPAIILQEIEIINKGGY